MTGAPIYLVSACTSGEEFVAAFRRYADKTGLFVPIGEPLPAGCRSRFAVTLKDGGVMIEGEAEIVHSARTASVLHGRIGMTLRFLLPDEASKTMLGELEKARLAMRPAPPSVAPRPAEIPAEPRPVPPPVQGRIDAVNALAECVAIGDLDVLVPAPEAPATIATPPKAGPRFVVPAVPPAPGLGMAPRPLASLLPTGLAKPEARNSRGDRAEARPPSITPRAAPQPEPHSNSLDRRSDPAQAVPPISGFSQTLTAVAPLLDPGPTSDTFTAAVPPAPPTPAPRRAVEMPAAIPEAGPDQASPAGASGDRAALAGNAMDAVPRPSMTAPSAPTDIGGVLVEPLPPIEAVVATPSQEDESARTQIHAGAPPAPPALPAASAPTTATTPPTLEAADEDSDSAPSATHIGMPPIPRAATPASALPTVPRPAPPIVAPARPAVPEVEIAEPTDVSLGPPVPVPVPVPVIAPEPARTVEPPPRHASAAPPHDPPAPRARKTEIGVAITPSGALVLPATMTATPRQHAGSATVLQDNAGAPLVVDDDAIGTTRVVGGDNAVGVPVPAARPEPGLPEVIDDATPRPGGMPPATAAPASTLDPVPPAPTAPGSAPGPLPTGDWTIALDPQAPDGWTDPFETISAEHLTEPPAEPPTAPPAKPPASPPAKPPPAFAASPPAPDPVPRRPTPHRDELPMVEPKVQVDPTLIEPLRPMPPDPPLRPMPPDMPLQPDDPFRHAAASSPGMPMYEVPGGAQAASAPMPGMGSMPGMAPVPLPHPFLVPSGPPMGHAGNPPTYPLDPSYQMMPVAAARPAGGSGMGDPRYVSGTGLPVRAGRRRVVIVVVSALVAVVIGVVALAMFGDKRGPGTPDGDKVDPPRPVPAPLKPAQAPPAPPAARTDPAPPPPPTTTNRPADAPATVPGDKAAAVAGAPTDAAAPVPGTCFAEVSSVPPGAEIVVGQATVGTTPQKVTLPCSDKVELVIRKARLLPATRTITPTPEGVKLKVALAKPTFLIKVSSTPAGATITMSGKSLGVTPTTVKVPAFESSTLTIAKDGYATGTEKVTPKANGVAVHTALKKLDRKKPR